MDGDVGKRHFAGAASLTQHSKYSRIIVLTARVLKADNQTFEFCCLVIETRTILDSEYYALVAVTAISAFAVAVSSGVA